MDIRELLVSNSASELDESSPVSAPDLHLLKDRLHVRSLQIKDRVHKYVKSHYQDFSSIIFRASDGASKVENISDNLNVVLQLLDKPSTDDAKGLHLPIDIDVDLCQLATQAKALNKCLNEKKEALALVQTISQFVQRLQNAQQNMTVEQGRLVESAQALNLLRFALRVPENWKDGEIGVSWEPKAFTLLQSQWVSCFSKLQDLLEDMFDSAIEVHNANSKLQINLHISCEKLPASLGGVELSSVLTAMDGDRELYNLHSSLEVHLVLSRKGVHTAAGRLKWARAPSPSQESALQEQGCRNRDTCKGEHATGNAHCLREATRG